MQTKTTRVHLDWSRLLGFSQVTTNREKGEFRSLKSPAMMMFGGKVCKRKQPDAGK